ncbi:DUF4160 domain-containing protein (plasmid) [Shewanella sp. LC6]|uniref:DUF4160 domain-containing protein n=1 Tax=unclassified Shewanella TaxID=196818 RepID=UPI000B49A8D4|nr:MULTISPECIES: DUF4160 domain-containing protein [unclassified Shewanella]QQK62503.1 DUF4160 domain-containing protein [Shewanella sp. LC6]TPE56239.1 DUF4160 domain-containing protein [Shewanella sp. LC2]
MPTISMFYGIIVYMYCFDNKRHKQAHIHATFAEFKVSVAIPSGDVLEGNFPAKKLKLLQAWIAIHEDELMADWSLAIDGEKPYQIDPLR